MAAPARDRTTEVVARALSVMALALALAAGTLFAMVLLVYLSDDFGGWPGRFWFAIVPLLVAAATLQLGAVRLRDPEVLTADWGKPLPPPEQD
jgi:MFS family permease